MPTRAGAGLYQLDRSFGSGVTTLAMAHGAEKYGLWNRSDEIYDNGRFKGMGTGSIAGYDLLRANPEEWALRVALPLLQSHGVNVDDTNAMAKAINEISRGNKNLNVILDELLLPANRLQLAKERANIDRVPDEAASILQRNDPAAAMSAFTTQWDNLLTALGKPLVADAVATLNRLTEAIQFLAKSAADHPEITRIGGELAAVAAGIAVLAGSVGVLRFALRIGRGASILADVGAGAAGAAGGGAASGAVTAGEGAAAGALGVFVKRLGVLGAVIGVTEWLDPKGNFGGLTTPLDNWFKQRFGFDPSNVTIPGTDLFGSANAYHDAQQSLNNNGYGPGDLAREEGRERARGGALSSTGQIPLWRDSWFSFGDQAKVDLALHRAGYTDQSYADESRRESRRALIMGSPQFARATTPPPAPIVNTETKVDVKVLLDGRAIAAAVEKHIVSNNAFVNSASGHDGMASPTYPDFAGP